ncbi:MAG: SOS response-associated peptidase [Ilumatobacteraceae bacterium]
MCGRFVATTTPQQLALLFDAVLDDPLVDQWTANFNVAPTTQILHLTGSVTSDGEERVLRRAHWGLLPAWSKDRRRAASMINARSETLAEKPSFRPLLATHRCVVPVDGYYEWKTTDVDPRVKQPKQPYFVRSADASPLAIAGLWTTWRDPQRGGEQVRSCSLITTAPNARLAAIHDRMPCILDGDDVDEWLCAPEPPLHLLRTAPDDRLSATTVSTAVNNVRNKGPELIEPTRTTLF